MNEMELIGIVAHSSNYIIGNKNKLPGWKLPADMMHFKKMTIGNACIMGRKTYESFDEKYRPLPDRDNIVLTHKPGIVDPALRVFEKSSILKALSVAEEHNHTKCFIIGGAEVYKQFLKEEVAPINKFIVTEIKALFEGDTLFPGLNPNIWKRNRLLLEKRADEKNSHDFEIWEYVKM